MDKEVKIMREINSEVKKYDEAYKLRNKYVEDIIKSESLRKIVVAGPGTGKTYLFKEILKEKDSSITLTFINSLVEDLSLELYKISDVKTLHSFARSILSRIKKTEIKIHPKLSDIIVEDAKILLDQEIDFNRIFQEMKDEEELIGFYKRRKNYYNYYGYNDIIYAAIKIFEKNKNNIPRINQIVIDEFQDFNLLEVSLIDYLAVNNPILIAGDDDQALYDFKSARTDFIRDRYNGLENFQSFSLPFCSRCTKVIVETANDLIDYSKRSNFLQGRIDKLFNYFPSKEKDEESDLFPKIGFTKINDNQISWFIGKQIDEFAKLLKRQFSVLIISPFTKQSEKIALSLKKNGFKNIDFKSKEDNSISLIDGYKLLLQNKDDKLGWRIVSKFFLEPEYFNELIKNTDCNLDKNIVDLIDNASKQKIKKLRACLVKIINGQEINNDDFDEVIQILDIKVRDKLSRYIIDVFQQTGEKLINQAIVKIPIKATTTQSSKGLTADLVFFTHFDDRYLISEKGVTDKNICNLLVSITRAKKKLYLISTVNDSPIFLSWINNDRIDKIS